MSAITWPIAMLLMPVVILICIAVFVLLFGN